MSRNVFALASAGAVALVAVAVGLTGLFGGSGVQASRSQFFGDAVKTLVADDGSAAAYVNGVAIPEAKVHAYLVLASTTFGETGQPVSVEDYLSGLIDDELMFQEAQKRGLNPGDTEVLELARSTKVGLKGLMSGDSQAAIDLRKVFAQVEGTPYHVDAYDTSPAMLDAFRRQIAVNALRSALLEGTDPATARDPDRREAYLDSFVESLRADADIRVQ